VRYAHATGGSLTGERKTKIRVTPARAIGVLSCAVALAFTAGCQRGSAVSDKPQALSPGRIVGGPGDAPGRFIKPRAIDSDGKHLVVIDRSGRIQVLDPEEGRCVAVWRLPETHLGYPTGVTIAPSPRGDGAEAVWVADTHYNRVLVYAMPSLPTDGSMNTTQPQLLLELGKYGTGPGEFTYPCDVLVLTEADGKTIKRVYVPEFGGNDRVSVFEPQGGSDGGGTSLKFVSQIGHAGDAADPEGFQRPQSIVLRKGNGTRPDELVLTDSINHRVGRFTLDGKLIAWFNGAGVPGKAPGQFWHPRGLTLLEDGTAMVVEFGNNRLQRIDLDTGACLGLFGAPGAGEGEIAEPWAVASVGRRGFVVDAHNHRLVEMKLPSAGLHFLAGSGTVSPLAQASPPAPISHP
jgi:DNA-binding beta-propeller fold protein YncE